MTHRNREVNTTNAPLVAHINQVGTSNNNTQTNLVLVVPLPVLHTVHGLLVAQRGEKLLVSHLLHIPVIHARLTCHNK